MSVTAGSKMTRPIFIGRWTPRILFSLNERPYRHGQLRRQLAGVSQRMLTRTLRTLESRGLIARRVTGSKTVAVEYSLTPMGKTIIAPLGGMCRWARRHGRRVSDLTGIFCTSGSEREFTLKERWYADKEIQTGADCHAAAAD
ncbi:MAG: helix-turn-helix domain-containing protein [Candidatus Acidiferrum sp.]